VEAPVGQERQELPVGGEPGGFIAEASVGGIDDVVVGCRGPCRAKFAAGTEERHWLSPGKPLRISGPRQLIHAAFANTDQTSQFPGDSVAHKTVAKSRAE